MVQPLSYYSWALADIFLGAAGRILKDTPPVKNWYRSNNRFKFEAGDILALKNVRNYELTGTVNDAHCIRIVNCHHAEGKDDTYALSLISGGVELPPERRDKADIEDGYQRIRRALDKRRAEVRPPGGRVEPTIGPPQ